MYLGQLSILMKGAAAISSHYPPVLRMNSRCSWEGGERTQLVQLAEEFEVRSRMDYLCAAA